MKSKLFLAATIGSIVTSQAALTTGLVNYYNFDDLSNDAEAASGSDATISGAAVGQAGGVFGNAATFTGAEGQLINTSDGFGTGSTALGESFTVTAWYKLDTDASTASGSRFFVFESATDYDVSYGLRDFNTVKATGQSYTRDGSTAKEQEYVNIHTAGVWQHALITVTALAGTSTIETYIDGISVGTLTANTTALEDTGFNIGNARDSELDRAMDGMIDEFATWDRVLTSEEISQVYNNGLSGQAVTAVPEPSSSALIGLGGLALILRRRK